MGRPEVQDVSGAAAGLEALVDVLAQIHGEAAGGAEVAEGTGPTPLRRAPQRGEHADLREHALEGDLLAQEQVVDGASARLGYTYGFQVRSGCGDHCPIRDLFPIVARSRFRC